MDNELNILSPSVPDASLLKPVRLDWIDEIFLEDGKRKIPSVRALIDEDKKEKRSLKFLM